MLFTTNTITENEIKTINNFFTEYENTQQVAVEEVEEVSNVTKYLHSLVTSCYQKSVDEINTQGGSNRIVRKRSLQQIMQQSFFYGANRFGTNFIA